MPMYEYKCSHCGHVTECLRKVEERNNALHCEKCGARMNLLVSGGNFKFYGVGAHSTDYNKYGPKIK